MGWARAGVQPCCVLCAGWGSFELTRANFVCDVDKHSSDLGRSLEPKSLDMLDVTDFHTELG